MRRTSSGLLASALFLISFTAFANAQTNSKTTQPGQVTPTGNLSVRRFSQTATLLPNGKVLIAGGMERNGKYDASAELYDPRTGTFTAIANMSSPREGHAAVLLRNGMVLIAGGSSGPDGNVATAELYDPATGTFHPTGKMAGPRAHTAAVLLNDGKVLLIGGDGAHEDERLSSAEIYDPATGRFSTTGSMSTARHKLAAVLLSDGRVLVVGGSDNRDSRGQYASAELYDPATGRFSSDGDMSFKRFKLIQTAVRLPDGRVLIAGGAERPAIYDPATKSFHPVNGTVGEGRYFSTATLLSDGRVLIAGGYGDDAMAGAVPNGWLYRP